ncbi:MAG: DNA-protecting protein DprA, partial [Parvularculaceae bacterium]|nr:DNA-protecting protein DprA [Parvularculaceae bacterium]
MEKFLHALNCVPGFSRRTLARIWKTFGGWRYPWESASFHELTAAGLKPEVAERLCEFRKGFDAEREFAKLWEKDIVVVSRASGEYPSVLFQLPDAPFLLYRKGATMTAHPRMIAVVGTRNPSVYGEKIAYDLAEALAQRGVSVVSGLAFGIDAIAHFSTVSCSKPTIAVLASGLFDIIPTTHHRLSEKILETGGTLLSEYPPSDPAYPIRFLERNRIIAGLCEATVVIEAGEKSGALVTARLANEYNRDVYALPGDITRPQARGCLELLSRGAHPLLSIDQFLEDRGLSSQKILSASLTENERQVVEALSGGPCSTDQLAELTFLPIQKLNASLSELEFR